MWDQVRIHPTSWSIYFTATANYLHIGSQTQIPSQDGSHGARGGIAARDAVGLLHAPDGRENCTPSRGVVNRQMSNDDRLRCIARYDEVRIVVQY